ncbi:unnamed protein product [Pieris macdunnoughi]|uniref:Uncharacterized protein n=1 Tax=Pieris macdunnoughi TaxID=345717 RepID=A0A821XXH3_9NEOP|nr:unnamed protein product [Pieris macdunnoughi]
MFVVNPRQTATAFEFTVDKISSRPGRPPKRASGVGLSLAASPFPGHPFKKHRLENGDYSPYENGHMSVDETHGTNTPRKSVYVQHTRVGGAPVGGPFSPREIIG